MKVSLAIVLFAALLSAAIADILIIESIEPCYKRASICCRYGVCRLFSKSYDQCVDREEYFCPFEGSC